MTQESQLCLEPKRTQSLGRTTPKHSRRRHSNCSGMTRHCTLAAICNITLDECRRQGSLTMILRSGGVEEQDTQSTRAPAGRSKQTLSLFPSVPPPQWHARLHIDSHHPGMDTEARLCACLITRVNLPSLHAWPALSECLGCASLEACSQDARQSRTCKPTKSFMPHARADASVPSPLMAS
jgi:hypothetical protein